MQQFIQTLVNGLTTGSLYALIALGYTMVYGVLKLLNFAHGDLFMVGAFVGYFAIGWFGGATSLVIPAWLLVIIMLTVASLGVGGLGVAIERFAYRPLRNAPRITPLITALGVSFVLENSVLLLFGGLTRYYNTPAFIPFSVSIHIDGVSIGIVQMLIFGGSIALMFVLLQLVNKTVLGKSMRAVASDREAAEMLGINVDHTIAMTFFIGSAMAGAAGVMYGLYANQVANLIGFLAGLKAFTAAVVGGIGSIPGAMIGGMFIGLCESFSLSYISTRYGDLTVFAILIAVMLIRPTGIFGRAPLQKV
ncbi:MAG TPA: branched-chain amino acid ABC transporter permease [Solirubrobacteraceae bacterium]|jgi:branched-chain amino acid transport system permease protein